ncbi:MAG: DUF1631 domain-containing protein [Pseudomonadota bacterium]
METARKNVTELSQFARARGKSHARGPLDDCRELAGRRLGEALTETLGWVAEQLLLRAEKASGMELYHLHMDTLDLARERGPALVEKFRAQFLWRFNRECRRDVSRPPETTEGELSLIEADDLEETLAADTLANAIFNACSEELYGLGKRVGLLINDPDLSHGVNPVGPEVIGHALMDALGAQEAPIKVRLLLISLLNRRLPERVRDIYRELNRALIERNVLPTIRVGLRKSDAATAAAPPGGARSEPSTSAAMASPGGPALGNPGGGDLFAMLQQLMASTITAPAMIAAPPMPGEPATATASGPVPAAAAGALLQALSHLQQGHPDGVSLAGIDPAQLGNGQVNLLRGLKTSGVAGMMSPLDGMTLDIVAMVFDYILGDARIPDAMKALIGRLQIPMLKVAMLDKSFFSQKNHPARALLDALADAAIGWDASEGHEGGLYRKVEDIIDGILARFEDHFDIFESALADLRDWLDNERQAADQRTARSALVIKHREEADLSRQLAHEEVETALVGRPVPAPIRTFLQEYWVEFLASLHLRAGSESEPWRSAVSTMNDLIWSVAPKIDADARKRLVAMLPGLLKRLDEGVRCIGLGNEARDTFFSSLVRCHAEAVRAGLLDEGDVTPMAPELPFENEIPVFDPPSDFVPVEPVAENEPVDAEAILAPAPIELAQAIELAAPSIPQAGTDYALASLKRGSWIAYAREDGAEVRAKLSWISPMKGVYLFTNRQGERAMSINAEGLAAKIASGEVRVLDAAPLMDRAVDSLVEQLKRNAP